MPVSYEQIKKHYDASMEINVPDSFYSALDQQILKAFNGVNATISIDSNAMNEWLQKSNDAFKPSNKYDTNISNLRSVLRTKFFDQVRIAYAKTGWNCVVKDQMDTQAQGVLLIFSEARKIRNIIQELADSPSVEDVKAGNSVGF